MGKRLDSDLLQKTLASKGILFRILQLIFIYQLTVHWVEKLEIACRMSLHFDILAAGPAKPDNSIETFSLFRYSQRIFRNDFYPGQQPTFLSMGNQTRNQPTNHLEV